MNKVTPVKNFESEIFSEVSWALNLMPLRKEALRVRFTEVKIGPKSKPKIESKIKVRSEDAIDKVERIEKVEKKEKPASLEIPLDDSMIFSFLDERWPSLDSYVKSCEEKYTIDSMIKENQSEFQSEGVDILFIGEKLSAGEFPLLLSSSYEDDLIGRMIIAMKLSEGRFVRRRIMADINWQNATERGSSLLENLSHEIYFFRPKVVITMGAGATNMMLGRKERLSRVHGQTFKAQVNLSSNRSFDFAVVPIFHPDFLQINPSMKRTAWLDLQEVMKLY